VLCSSWHVRFFEEFYPFAAKILPCPCICPADSLKYKQGKSAACGKNSSFGGLL